LTLSGDIPLDSAAARAQGERSMDSDWVQPATATAATATAETFHMFIIS
jgi:hypothetical protein